MFTKKASKISRPFPNAVNSPVVTMPVKKAQGGSTLPRSRMSRTASDKKKQ